MYILSIEELVDIMENEVSPIVFKCAIKLSFFLDDYIFG